MSNSAGSSSIPSSSAHEEDTEQSEHNHVIVNHDSSALLFIPDDEDNDIGTEASHAAQKNAAPLPQSQFRDEDFFSQLSAINRQRSHINETVRALMAILSSEAKLSDVKAHQGCTLDNLDKIKHNLIDMNKKSNEQYQACVTDFLKAARQARQAKDDLNDISRRLSNINNKLNSKP